MMEESLKPITVFVSFSPELATITKQLEMKITMNDGAPFGFLLHSILTSYPEIQNRYPPGVLGFVLNNHPPAENDPLKDGDKVAFSVEG